MMDRELLIEKAAKAMLMVTQVGVNEGYAWSAQYDEVREELIVQARAALAVFEEAHTPSNDEREALGIVVANFISPAGYEVAELDYILADRILAAGFRRPAAPEPVDSSEPRIGLNAGAGGSSRVAPTDDEREVLARALFIASDDFAYADRMAKAWDAPGPHGRARWYNYADAILAAGFRRPASPWEPQGEPSDAVVSNVATAIRKATNGKVPWSWEDAARAALRAAAAVTEQGEQRHEPTKEELDAAITAYKRSAHIHPGRTHMLAALRAAAAVTEQGENR